MIERFVEQYADKGYQFAFHLCGNPEDAKELVQEAFVRVIAKWETYNSEQPLENWFLSILRNLYFDGLRRYERRRAVSLDAPVPDHEGESFADLLVDTREEGLLGRLERQEASCQVQRALAALSPEHRAILTLIDVDGLGYEQVTEVLDCPLGTVRSRISRARDALKRALLTQGEEVLEP